MIHGALLRKNYPYCSFYLLRDNLSKDIVAVANDSRRVSEKT
jgi:hypothetical protein